MRQIVFLKDGNIQLVEPTVNVLARIGREYTQSSLTLTHDTLKPKVEHFRIWSVGETTFEQRVRALALIKEHDRSGAGNPNAEWGPSA